MGGSNERVNPSERLGVSIGRTGAVAEQLQTIGKYHFECRRPMPERLGEFLRLRDRFERRRAIAQSLLRARLTAPIGALFMRAYERLRDEALKLTFVAWEAECPNTVVTVGKNDLLDKYLAGSAYTASCALGLKGTGSVVAGDTMSSHAGWSEVGGTNAPAYTGNRATPSWSSASSGTKATSSAASYSITSSGTVDGAFLTMGGSTTKDNTTGVLFSAGTFSGGSRSVINGDTVNVTYSLAA